MSKRESIIKGILLAAIVLLGNTFSYGQLTGSKSIPGDYNTIAAAVTAVNSAGVGTGGVIFNIAAGYTETNTAVISLTATGTVTNPITFRKDPLTSGANPLITAHTTGVPPAVRNRMVFSDLLALTT